VEISVLFSFFVYRAFVWQESRASWRQTVFRQLPVYHISVNISVLSRIFAIFPALDWLGVHYTVNNIIGIAAGSAINYILSDRLVFRRQAPSLPQSPQTGNAIMAADPGDAASAATVSGNSERVSMSRPVAWPPAIAEYAIPLLVIVSLVASCIISSPKKYFWNDELYSYYLLATPSFTGMLAAFADKINNSPPLYFFLGWAWVQVFGAGELSLRLFSSAGIGAAACTIWATVRRTYGFWPASVGVVGVFCLSPLIFVQNGEARMYGLFMAACAVAIWHADRLNGAQRISIPSLALSAGLHAAIVHTHLFGVFYSGAILLAMLVRDGSLRTFRPGLYISVVLGWLTLFPYVPIFLIQADAGRPRTWIPLPTWLDLAAFYLYWYPPVLLAVVLCLVFAATRLSGRNGGKDRPCTTTASRAALSADELLMLAVAVTFLLVPLAIWVGSLALKPLFIARYMIPSLLAWPILLAHAFSRLVAATSEAARARGGRAKRLLAALPLLATRRSILVPLLAGLLAVPIATAVREPIKPNPGSEDSRLGYTDLPIVVQNSHFFLERLQYAPERDRYFFITDWQAATAADSGLFTPQEYKHLDALRRQYPARFAGKIIDSDDFLSRFQRFLVLDEPDYDRKCGSERAWRNFHCPKWLEMRVLADPGYRTSSLGDVGWRQHLLLVERNNAAMTHDERTGRN
jgi:hypothetical protein